MVQYHSYFFTYLRGTGNMIVPFLEAYSKFKIWLELSSGIFLIIYHYLHVLSRQRKLQYSYFKFWHKVKNQAKSCIEIIVVVSMYILEHFSQQDWKK